jgi:HAMP domain-containing protein
MRWLMTGLLVSLGALLLAAAGVARHIWLQRRKQRREMLAALDAARETDVEIEP